MALSKSSCKKAFEIFAALTTINNKTPLLRTEDNQYHEQKVIGIDKKQDGGWECLFINIKDVTPEQLQVWEQRKGEVHNSSSNREVQPGITRLYFY
jgi:hypothetical protein